MSRPKSIDATPHQRKILAWVKSFIHDHEMPPTVREIGKAFGIKSAGVFYMLKELQRKGYIQRGKLGARSLIVKGYNHQPRDYEDLRIIGHIAAGPPGEAIEYESGTLHVQRALLRRHEGFVLRVNGDSMIEVGIFDGDLAIVRKQNTAEEGDIVVALIGDDATLKKFYREPGGVRLEPANRKMKPIHVKSGNFRIQGKVVAIHREL